jgi:ABC-type dipeptide/oligopeptide/nickel transport system permease subunit
MSETKRELEEQQPSAGGMAPTPTHGGVTQHSGPIAEVGEPTELSLTWESGVELKTRSQLQYAAIRFLRHRLAMGSLVVLFGFFAIAIFAPAIAPYAYDEIDLNNIAAKPTTTDNHFFGTDLLGRDYFSRVIFGIRTSLWVALVVAFLSTAIGTAIGAIAGYFGGLVDNALMRITDLFLTLPGLPILLVAAVYLGAGKPLRVAIILALLFWTGIARVVRGVFLSLREKEYVEAAKASGSGDTRIILRHMLPNTVGPIIVNATLVVAVAILTEAGLSFLGFGIQPPTPALGRLIADGQSEGLTLWWLVTFPGLVIVMIALAINFIGDGLRDSLDPTQRRIRA